jgi:hypothetical protein
MISNKDKEEIRDLFAKLYETLYHRQPKNYEYTKFLTERDGMIEQVLAKSKQDIINILYEYLKKCVV